jgi:hypothetical protein
MKSDEEFFEMKPPKYHDKKHRTSVEINKSSSDNAIQGAIGVERLGLIFRGILCIVCLGLGFVLIILGINGSINFEIKSSIIITKLANSSPGVLLCVLGIILAIFTVPNIKIK